MARSLKVTDIDNYNGTQIPGYYQRTKLEDIINNFIVGYIGKDKVLQNVARHEVAFWAQRSLQEFSYDVLHQERSIELEMNPNNVVLLPPDYVNYIKLTKTDGYGNTRTIQPSLATKANSGALQDENYDYIYDENGNQIFVADSESITKFQRDDGIAKNYYTNYYEQDDYSYFQMKRFGTDPIFQNGNGHYVIDNVQGRIYFDAGFTQGDVVTLYYISDGLANNDDLANVYVPKMAEDAMYAAILYNISKLRPAAGGAVSLYKKEAMAKLRNAKIRLSNYKHEELAQVLRGKAKWIKH